MNDIQCAGIGPFNTIVLATEGISGAKMAFLEKSEYFSTVNFITHTDQIPTDKNSKNQPDVIVVCVDPRVPDNAMIIPWIKKKLSKVKVLVSADNYTYDMIKTSFLLGADGFIGREACEKTVEKMILQNISHGLPAVTNDAVTVIVQRMQGDKFFHDAADQLSVKQKTIAKLLVRGYSYVEIASQMQQSIDLVRYHVKQIYTKLGIKTKIQLMPYVELE
jgi:DNA-binding NarL/FixJ family response regulator